MTVLGICVRLNPRLHAFQACALTTQLYSAPTHTHETKSQYIPNPYKEVDTMYPLKKHGKLTL